MKNLLILFIIISSNTYVISQPGWNWPEDKASAEERNVLYTDYLKQGNCDMAIESNRWLVQNVPGLHVSIYQNAVKILRCLIDKEEDPDKKNSLIQEAISIFDKRIENFGREAYVKNRKSTFAYTFYRSDKTQYENLYNMFSEALELNGNKLGNSNIVGFMDIVRKHKLTSKTISDDQVLDIYDKLSNVVSFKRSDDPKNIDRLKRYQDNLDKLLTATITVDCNFVENTLGPKLNLLVESPSDEIIETDYENLDPVEGILYSDEVLNLAKKIFQLSITGKCTSSDIALSAAKIMFTNEKDFAIAKFIAGRELSSKNYEASLEYYDGALLSTDDTKQKSEIYLNKAQLYALVGNKIKSRDNARMSISSENNSEAYKLIGNLYMASYEECKGGKSRVNDRLVFIAAYNMFKRAGLNIKAAQAKAQFPSMEEIFNENLEVGESLNTGCWINEKVTLSKRE